MINFQDKVNFIWSIAELLRGPYKKEQYGDVILPMAVLRRFDCVLAATKDEVLEKYEALKKSGLQNMDPVLNRISKQEFNNTSKYDFEKLLAEPDDIANNLRNYINGFSKNAREIIEHFDFDKQITKLNDNNLLYLVVSEFNKIDLHPDKVSNTEMGYIFEELIRRFSEHAEAGDHYTPREVIRLMVNILLNEDNEELTQPGLVVTVYDCCAGTGGMLSVAEQYLKELNPGIQVELFGQEINPQSFSICKSDMLIKGQNADNIILGDSFTEDGHRGRTFRYMLTNPPFGVEWKKAEKFIREEYEKEGYNGRFGAGLPRISDGSLLFLQHLISKMKQDEKGSRIAIIFNGSPLFTGDAGSGESEIRRWIIENDMLEGIIALPDQLFYNTGISTYIWIVTNRKNNDPMKGPVRTGKIQLVNAVDFYQKMRKSLGNKRNEITEEQIKEITRIYGEFKENEYCKIFDNEDFGYQKIVIERPLRLNFQVTEERINNLYNETAFSNLAKSKKKGTAGLKEIEKGRKLQQQIIETLKTMDSTILYKNRDEFTKVLKKAFKDSDIKLDSALLKAILSAISEKDETADICVDSNGNPEPDPDLRDTENVPLKEDIYEYFKREVKPHVPDAWIDETKTKIGYEIPFTRHFYKYQPLRPSEEIMREIIELEKSISEKLKKVMGE
ncbi:restriction endonuclease subunit M [Clostridium thermosuccinogenes]|uniref:site-specific DNA-methyltransferase (adenine-specific) n=1 Tax=Clostridium thermosuccinogenes TaxID=84032 RepID=A0A2K2F701_9CLOT|nr:class I SAM-dependent DNA methyltransferase [Pseudoclostridium thermosuccinogenes]AUS95474.1 restriction endonuclease subunit M [Pseudoclostridium thermosuccinogenes]PNT94540.1 restriction endonuclease subunit M [Pseudoclostridium thermosuccinogenes]PNT94989.1 restriction endonuclease subunit M [Pseudoclostridium thermosuccinogenes]